MSYTIGIDLGTTNTKAIALSDNGEILCELSRPTETVPVPTGGELDPKRLAADLDSLLRAVLSKVKEKNAGLLTAIGLTGMAEAGFLADRQGEPITPILLWYDQRGAEEAEELREAYEDLLTSVSGIRMSNVAAIYKLAFLKKQLNAISGTEMRWIGVPEWAAWILTGEHFTDRTLAVRTGAYALESGEWSSTILRVIGADLDLFPKIIPSFDQDIRISETIAEKLKIPAETRIRIAGHDDIAAAFGAGLSERVWVDSTGTAEGLIALTSPLPDPRRTVRSRMSIAPWYISGKWALIAGVGTSGSLISALHEQTGLPYEAIDFLAGKREVYPENALKTELTPQRLAKVEFLPDMTDAQKVSAVYDRIIMNFTQRVLQISQFAELPDRLVITGGHSRLPELNRRKSEALGNIPITARPEPEAAAYGAAKIALLWGKFSPS